MIGKKMKRLGLLTFLLAAILFVPSVVTFVLLSAERRNGITTSAVLQAAAPPGLQLAGPDATHSVRELASESSTPEGRLLADRGSALDCLVQDELANPVAFASVVFQRSLKTAAPRGVPEDSPRTDVTGQVQLDLPGESGRFFAFHPGYATVMPFEFSPERPFDKAVIVVGLQVTYQGEVREVSGAPIVGCFVTLAMDEATQRRILGERERSRGARWEAVTREDGRFRFADVAWSQGLRLEIDDPAYLRKRVEVPPISQDDMLVVLEPRADSRTLYGVVLEPDGALVPRALVVADDGRVVRSDAAGVFALDGAPGRPRTLTAFQRGFLPGRTVTDSSGGTWEEPFRVVLGGRPLSIQGRVEDAAGHPVEGALVWIANYTNLLVRGLPLDGDLTYSGSTSEEALIQEAHACRPVRSNSAGCFELQGLTDRDYQVCAVHPTTLLHAIAAGSPGDPLVLGLPSGELRTIEGRIVSLHGQPIPDVIVFLRRHLGRGPGLDSPSGGRCTASDELGRFSFKDVCEDGAYLEFAGDQIPEVERFEVPPTLSFEVTLPAMRKFRVELDDPERADSFCVIDGSQKPLEMRSRIGNETLVSPLMDLARGTSEILLVSERASAIRLYREGSLVTTASLFLAGEGLNLVTIPR